MFASSVTVGICPYNCRRISHFLSERRSVVVDSEDIVRAAGAVSDTDSSPEPSFEVFTRNIGRRDVDMDWEDTMGAWGSAVNASDAEVRVFDLFVELVCVER